MSNSLILTRRKVLTGAGALALTTPMINRAWA